MNQGISIEVLQIKLDQLKTELLENESELNAIKAESRRRLEALEEANKLLENRLRMGGGILFGFLLALATIGIIAFDKFKAGLANLLKLIT